MNKIIVLYMLFTFLLGLAMGLPSRHVSNQLQDLNSKIDKIVIFLDLNVGDEDTNG